MTDSTDNARGLDLHRLISWGFAPGSYTGFCSECSRQHTADKRAWRCLECAERRADLAPDPQGAKVKDLVEKAQALLDLNDNYSPFGGEIYRDRVDRTWDEFRAALAAFDKGCKDE